MCDTSNLKLGQNKTEKQSNMTMKDAAKLHISFQVKLREN